MIPVEYPERQTEAEKIEAWRLRCLLEAGYLVEHAEQLARRNDVDLHQAVGLLERGCPEPLAHAILA